MTAIKNQNSVVPATRWELKMAQSQAFRLMESQCPAHLPDDLSTPEIPETTGKVASAGIKYLSALFGQLIELRKQDEFDEYGASRLDAGVFDRARLLLVDTAITLIDNYAGAKMPHGCASTDDEGGLRVEWFRDYASVHLVIPVPTSTVKPYIFHNIGGTSAIDPIVSDDVLARWLSQIGD